MQKTFQAFANFLRFAKLYSISCCPVCPSCRGCPFLVVLFRLFWLSWCPVLVVLSSPDCCGLAMNVLSEIFKPKKSFSVQDTGSQIYKWRDNFREEFFAKCQSQERVK